MTERTALVTGGSSGIGAAICQHLAEAGYRVVNLSRRKPASAHSAIVHYSVDLSDLEATRQAAAEIAATYPVTSIVNNAGVVRAKPLEEVAIADLDALTRIHLGAAIILTQAMLPAMKAAGFGRIVNMSTRAILGLATRTCYSGTKAALVSITRTWAMELGRHGITVNAIAPGPVVSEMFSEVVPTGSPVFNALSNLIPVGRIGSPDDVARATMFFLDPANSYVTGQLLYVCGGSSMGSLIDGGLNAAMQSHD
ncbi:SDR family NAD(P)-dependent oxidoreductase [Sphingomonas flavalba]|uniref:SDR family NAD(P)-dependent oxidoreductase n=1 Tax=Sphingomonas flavalba TaxID=2559804 RepID=UPI0039E1D985